jgi:hypothetical protein
MESCKMITDSESDTNKRTHVLSIHILLGKISHMTSTKLKGQSNPTMYQKEEKCICEQP